MPKYPSPFVSVSTILFIKGNFTEAEIFSIKGRFPFGPGSVVNRYYCTCKYVYTFRFEFNNLLNCELKWGHLIIVIQKSILKYCGSCIWFTGRLFIECCLSQILCEFMRRPPDSEDVYNILKLQNRSWRFMKIAWDEWFKSANKTFLFIYSYFVSVS
jgi:hypothetical protein